MRLLLFIILKIGSPFGKVDSRIIGVFHQQVRAQAFDCRTMAGYGLRQRTAEPVIKHRRQRIGLDIAHRWRVAEIRDDHFTGENVDVEAGAPIRVVSDRDVFAAADAFQ